jgi:hypothetical protein
MNKKKNDDDDDDESESTADDAGFDAEAELDNESESESQESDDSEGESDKPKVEYEEQNFTIDGVKFRCWPTTEDAIHDPSKGKHHTDEDGNLYWCVPLDDYLKGLGRKYDSQGPKPDMD